MFALMSACRVSFEEDSLLTADSSLTNAGSLTSNNAIHLANNDLECRGEWPRSEGLSVGSY